MKRKYLRIGLIVLVIGAVVAIGIVLYLYNMPHRDVQAAQIDYSLSVEEIVGEYLTDESQANNKYLQEEGQSKILAVSGSVKSISQNLEGNYVVLLTGNAPSGVRCTFMTTSNENATNLKVGENVTIKGVIRSGAAYDEDLELYEDVILDKCDII